VSCHQHRLALCFCGSGGSRDSLQRRQSIPPSGAPTNAEIGSAPTPSPQKAKPVNTALAPTVADLADAHPAASICAPVFRDFGGVKRFAGPIRTLKLFEDNSLLRSLLETQGEGAVIVVDGGGSLRCALFGGNLGALAVSNGWAGVVINGCVRDSVELSQHAIGIKALACHPLKSEKGLHGGQVDCPATFADVTFVPGHWLYADEDGVLVLSKPAARTEG